MIISKKIEKFDKKVKFICYEKDGKGKISAKRDTPPMAGKEDLANVLYYTKAVELKRLKEEVLKGTVSPIHIFVTLQNMDLKDLAHRLKISYGKVKKHQSMEGFKKIKIELLEKYAKIFGASAADFFYFLNVDDAKKVDIKHYCGKLIEDITFKK